jgi:hypothetical protein
MSYLEMGTFIVKRKKKRVNKIKRMINASIRTSFPA